MKEIVVALIIITGLIAVPYLTGEQLVSVQDGTSISVDHSVTALAGTSGNNM